MIDPSRSCTFRLVRTLGSCVGLVTLLVVPAANALSVGDLVWNDLNGDGLRDAGEAGISDVAVTLYVDDGDGMPFYGNDPSVRWTTTDVEGRYQFSDLEAGSYFIRIESEAFAPSGPLFGMLSSPGAADPDIDPDDNDDSAFETLFPRYRPVYSPVFNLAPGTEPTDDGDGSDGNQTVDFGFYAAPEGPRLSLGNRIWLDDGDGVDEGEAGVPGVGLTLYRDLGAPGRDGMDEHVSGGSTEADGEFHFVSLPPGDYLVEVGPWNFNYGGALYGLMSSPGVADPENNVDRDDNGVDSPMPVNWGINSGRITLVAAGEPTDDGDDETGNQTLDFGFYSPPEPPVLVLGGNVWRDVNRDGLRDAGEPSVAGVGLSIIQVLPDGTEIHQGGAGTDAEGNYRFYGRPAGDYYVRVDSWNFPPGSALGGLVSTPGAAAADNDLRFDDNGVDAVLPAQEGVRSAVLTLAHGMEPTDDGDNADGNLTVDFGCIPGMTLGDRVFLDADGDGHFDAEGTGIADVQLRLYVDSNENNVLDSQDRYLAASATSSSGQYAFEGIAPGRYLVAVDSANFGPGAPLFGRASSKVEESEPDSDVDGDDNGLACYPFGLASAAITLTSGGEPVAEDGNPETNLTLDFGFTAARPLTLGNLVFQDLNNNGVRDEAEAGIAGVVVNLYRDEGEWWRLEVTDPLIASVTTGSDGTFEFPGLEANPSGPWYILEVPRSNFLPGGLLANWASSDANEYPFNRVDADDNGYLLGYPFGVGITSLSLSEGTMPLWDDGDPNTDLTMDFGFRPVRPLTLGNLVFADANNNGRRDPEEVGMGGVMVNLYRDDNLNCGLGPEDGLVSSVVTGEDGSFEFTNLAPTPERPTYTLEVALANFLPGGALENWVSSDANEYPPNGVDSDDNGYPVGYPYGVAITCLYLDYGQAQLAEDGDPNTDLTMDFGFRPARPLTLGNLVFADANNNGRRDAEEAGIGGVTVNLYLDDNRNCGLGPEDGFVASTVTGDDGSFEFTNLAPTPGGPEYILEVALSNFEPGGPLVGRVSSDASEYPYNGVDGDDNGYPAGAPFGAVITCLRAEFGRMPISEDGDPNTDLTMDFGFTQGFRLGNLVWADLDNDGLRDVGEPGIAGVEVQLWRDNGDAVFGEGDSYLRNTSTSAGGQYEFSGVTLGDYFVALPWSNHEVGRALVNRASSTGGEPEPDPTDEVDQDDNGRTLSVSAGTFDVSGLVALSPGAAPVPEDGDANTDLTVDFGFQQGPLPSVGNVVWNDLDNDGVRDAGEPGIAGVGVSLYADGGDGVANTGGDYGVMWTTSDPEGLYQFTGVAPGTYFIRIEYGSFAPGQPLFGFLSSSGVGDPDEDPEDGDDNGIDEAFPLYRAVHSPVFTVSTGGGPTNDGDDALGNQTIDFGFHASAEGPALSVGGRVWLDDGDGQDEGEPGIANVGLELRLDNGDGLPDRHAEMSITGVSTDSDGRYEFAALPPGNYFVFVPEYDFIAESPLHGLVSSPDPFGGAVEANTDVDGDDNGVDAPRLVTSGTHSTLVTLALPEPGEAVDGDGPASNQTVDFGFYSPPEPPVLVLGGSLWRDLDANGWRDAGEPGLAGVGLQLLSVQPDGSDLWMYGRTSDAEGFYLFTGLPAGKYRVAVWNWNFHPGSPLENHFSTPGGADPDLDAKDDDNGADSVDPRSTSIYSRTVMLSHGDEPDGVVDGDDTNGNRTLDFGFIELPGGPTLSVGGTVFADQNQDGQFGGDESGLANAFVALWIDNGDGQPGSGDVHAGSVPSTDATGNFLFSNLPPGDYMLQMYRGQFMPGAPLHGWRSSQGNGEPAPDPDDDIDNDDNGFEGSGLGESFTVLTKPVSLRSGTEPETEDGDPQSNLTVDLGFSQGSNLILSGTVFRDENANGAWQPGESGVEGVSIELWSDSNADGVPSPGDAYVSGMNTDAGGVYRSPTLMPGDYLVVIRYSNFYPVRPLNGLRSSLSTQTPEPAPDSNLDLDGDDDGTEIGWPGRPFFGVASRAVTLAFGQEPDLGQDGDGPDTNSTVDFGFQTSATPSVGDLVFRDENNNGLRDAGETGIPGVHVKLLYDNGDGVLGDGDEDLGVDVTTDSGGLYALPNLPAGTYLVVLPYDNWWPGRALNGLRSSTGNGTPPDPDADTTDGDDNGEERQVSFWPALQVSSKAFHAGPESDFSQHVDFGFYAGPTLTLGGLVFRDDNDNGVRDLAAGESGIADVEVGIYVDNGDGVVNDQDSHLGSVRTDAEGRYAFSGLIPGNYHTGITYWEQFYGRALTGLRTSTGNEPTPDPDDNPAPDDDNGFELSGWGMPVLGIWSHFVALDFGAEPTGDGDDANGNLTVGFGFRPVTGTTFIVNTADDHDDGACDTGDCTLREALNAANANPGTDTIRFDIGGGGAQLLQPASALPTAIEPVLLEATTQPGFTGMPLIELNGANAGPGAAGLVIQGGWSSVSGFVINRFDHGGIHVLGASHNVIQGNFIGTDSTGTVATGGTTSDHGGIYVSWSNDNRIGGMLVAERNLVSGNNVGIRCDGASRTLIAGNYVGTDVTGTLGVGNTGRAGIWINGGGQNQVGGAEAGAGNLVSGNNLSTDPWNGAGLLIEGSPGTVIEGNRIGTDAAGLAALGNQTGLSVSGPGVVVGGTAAGSGNLISGNRFQGVNLNGGCRMIGNLVGTDITGTQPLGNASIGVALGGTANVLGGTTAAERNVISANGEDGIVICGSPARGDNVIQGNYIGTDSTGTTALGNGARGWGPGIRTCGNNNFNVIGGEAPGAGNLIAGNNGSQVDLRSSDNVVQGNRIGTDGAGAAALRPGSGGIGVLETAERNLIADNLISGVDRGIYLGGSGVRATRVVGNRIGSTADGTGPVPNMVGVDVADSPDNVIGGVAAGEGNTIAFSSAYGISVGGSGAVNNVIRGNAIHSNGSLPGDWLGIDLAYGSPVTPNDLADTDEGPNHVQNYPILLQAAASGTALAIEGRFNSSPGTTLTLDFYANAACDPTGYGEGERYLAAIEAATDGSGDLFFHVNLPVAVAPGQFITATATDPAGNTSEFSACRETVAEDSPAILQAATRGAPNQVVVSFTESVDPATATDSGNYAASCAGVSSAAMLDPRTVLLTLNGPVMAGCLLTVNGVQDLAVPANTILANTQADIFQTLGAITRREYRHVPYGQVSDLTAHPRFPGHPSVIDYPTLLESPSNLGDNYGIQMLGYVHPPVTGEYVFYLSADETAELYLSSDENPGNKQLIARERAPHEPRQWIGGALRHIDIEPEQVLVPGAFFIEAEEFNHSGGQHEATVDAMPYDLGAYAGRSAVAEVDFHDDARNDNPTPEYRASDLPVEIISTTYNGPLNGDRGTFEVTSNYKVGWTAQGDWLNYTRNFGPAQDYHVYLAVASGNASITADLHEVTAGATTTEQTTVKLGELRGGTSQNWGQMDFIPLLDADGNAVVVNLGGERTLRLTAGPWDMNWDYLAFVPATGPAPEFRPENRSLPITLAAGQRYYLEALMKEGGGNDGLGVAWQMPGGDALADGDAPIAGAHLEAWIEPEVTTVPFVSLGGLVFKDENNNGLYEPPTDTPIPGVNIELWMDHDQSNHLYSGDWTVAYTVTDEAGRYGFAGLHPATYLVLAPQGEHYYGRPLTGLRTSTGLDPTPDPDTDLPGDDNGWLLQREDLHVRGTVTWGCTLTANGEPGAAVDGDDTTSNQTVDLGFSAVTGTTFTVNSTADPGDGVADAIETTLREAITAANANAGKDTIVFAIPGPGPHTIQPVTPLPDLNESTDLDATTQPGYAGKPVVELDGQRAGGGQIGLRVYGGASQVRGLCINRFSGGGIHIAYGGGNTISSCFLGTDLAGTQALMGFQGCYCYAAITVDSAENLVGGATPAERNLISGYDTGVWIRGKRNLVAGNFIGTDVSGTSAVPNDRGIYIEGAADNEIGGGEPAFRNLISGNLNTGVGIYGHGNRVRGNFIGTEVTGMAAVPNGTGVAFYAAAETVIGGTEPGEGNLISGNATGIDLRQSDGNRIEGNWVGLNVAGTGVVPGSGTGIMLNESAADNVIGGTAAGAGNTLAGLGARALSLYGPGVVRTLIQGNRLGTDPAGVLVLPNQEGIVLSNGTHDNVIGGTAAGAGNVITASVNGSLVIADEGTTGNSIRGNSMFDNHVSGTGLTAVDLDYNGVTLNDTGDSDTGPNLRQNFPELVYAASAEMSANTMVEGTLSSTPSSPFVLDIYGNTACDPAGFGEGRDYLGSVDVATDASGFASFLVNLPLSVAPGQVLTAIATDAGGNSSEFSRCLVVQPEGPPSLVSATTHGLPNRVTLVFSESLELSSATELTHYQIPGVSVLVAALGPDGRTVTLLTSPLPDGMLTIGYAGLADRAEPPNTVAPGVTGTILNTQGYLSRSVWYNVPGTRVSQLTGLASYPDQPDELTYEPWFEAPNDVADHYGQRLAGYLTAPVSGYYTFYIASDDASELWLSTDADPANKRRIAGAFWGLHSESQKRAWNSVAVNAPADQVLRADTRFIEAEDFDFGARQWITDQPIGMTGPYVGGAYAGLGMPADEGVDYHEFSADASADHYRQATGVEMYPLADPANDPHGLLSRGAYDVGASWKIGWNYEGEWRNYTRAFPAETLEYWVYARVASDGLPMAARLDLVGFEAEPEPPTLTKLGEFRSNPSSGWDNFVHVPLTDDSGQPVSVSLSGLQTLRITILAGNTDFDYLALVPVAPDLPAPVNRAENISAPIYLEEGHRYYIEALGRENGGGDHLSVTWQMPGGPVPANGDPPISGQYLSSLSPSGPVSIVVAPQDQTRDERAVASFSVEAQGTPPFAYQWFRNGNPIPGATSSLLTIPAVMPDDGAAIHVDVANAFSQATSTAAILHVIPDTVAPTVTAVTGGPSLDRVFIRFSEPLAATAGFVSHYQLNGGLSVTGASLGSDGTTVVLTTTPQVPNVRYTLELTGVTDTAHTPNPVGAGATAQFSSWTTARGFVLHRFFQDVPENNIARLRSDPRFPDEPTLTEPQTRIEWPPDGSNEGGSNYGNILSGWLVPPVTGEYTFYVSADDPAEVYLSTDDRPANKQLICNEPQWNNPRVYRGLDRRNPVDPENVSDPFTLVGGQRYYFEVLHTEGGGGDNVSLAWRVPGAPEVRDGDLPINAAFVECLVDPDRYAAAIASIDPTGVPANSPTLTLTVHGSGFRSDSVVHWNGAARATTFQSASILEAIIPAGDLASEAELLTATVTVVNFLGVGSNPEVFTIRGAEVTAVESDIAVLGETARTSSPPLSESQPGVAAAIRNEGVPDPVVLTTAVYVEPPPAEPPPSLIAMAGGYVDLKVGGADADDAVTSYFYYPANLTPEQEAAATLLSFNGTQWVAVLSSGGAAPAKDLTDNLDGTVSGGRFTVVFDDTSSPRLSQLTGSVFTTAGPESLPPVAVDDSFRRADDDTFKLRVANLLSNDQDPDGDALHMTGVSPLSNRGGTVILQGAWVIYHSVPGDRRSDYFTYTVSDGRNGLATARVDLLAPVDDPGPTGNKLSGSVGPDGRMRLEFAGIPRRTYHIQYTTDLGTGAWTTLEPPVECGDDGHILFVDPHPDPLDPMRFYRTVSP